jgi:DNA repair photolyase
MKAIYEPRGRAAEYAALACNLYHGCAHGCTYCYVPDIPGQAPDGRPSFYGLPEARAGILEALERDARTMQKAGDQRPVLLCFTCDPYQPIDVDDGLTRYAIEILHSYGVPVKILTKGGARAQRDFDLLGGKAGTGPVDEFGVTLTFMEPALSRAWEPGAALPEERLLSLAEAQRAGIKTWVSCEPIISLTDTLALIQTAAPHVNKVMVGKWNHTDAPVSDEFWRLVAHETKTLLDKLKADYYMKKDLSRYL